MRYTQLQGLCTFMTEEGIQLLLSNNHSQFVAAVNDKNDGMALPVYKKNNNKKVIIGRITPEFYIY